MRRVVTLFAVLGLWVFCFVAPAGAQESTTPAEDQYTPGADSECPGAKVVNTTSGDGDKQSPVFNITGESFRITTTLKTDSPEFLFFSAEVKGERGGFVASVD